ncbi:MAG: hypothetical protein LBL74_00185 [Bacteroidales bacterium]|jgi:hypothetical protein|nr:hypothetical protein [Bacteroidales bacterium]
MKEILLKRLLSKTLAIMFAATISVAMVGCADDEEPINNPNTRGANKISAADYEKEFESVDYSESVIHAMLINFNEALNNVTDLENKSIKDALFLMETYFNYGVVAKIDTNYCTPEDDKINSFELTLPLNSNEEIDGNVLKENYISFVGEVLIGMQGKRLPLADMKVTELDNNSVTFSLVLHSAKPIICVGPYRLKDMDNIGISPDIVTSWSLYPGDVKVDPYMQAGQYLVPDVAINCKFHHYNPPQAEPIKPCIVRVGVDYPGEIVELNALELARASLYMVKNKSRSCCTGFMDECIGYGTEAVYNSNRNSYDGNLVHFRIGRIVSARSVSGLFLPTAVARGAYHF